MIYQRKKLKFAASSASQERTLREDNFASSENLKQVNLFKKLIREGPYLIRVISNRCLYKRYIVRFDFNSYSSLVKELVHLVSSYDGRLYICRNCHNKVKKNNVPCQAVSNRLAVELLPKEFRDLRRLERVLVAERILFKKVTVMPKVQSPKVKGSICNIPISEIDNNCNSLPRPADSNGVIIVKLKRKAAYRGHMLFEPIRPRLTESLLQYLKKHNHLYRKTEIEIESIPEELQSQIGNISEENAYNYLVKNITNPIDIIIDSLVGNKDHEEINPSGIRISGSGILDDVCMNQEINDDARSDQKIYIEDSENPLAQFQNPSAETTITTEIPTSDELEEGIIIAPGEDIFYEFIMCISTVE